MKKFILILALLFSINLVGQNGMVFTKRPFKLAPYSITMAVPITGYSLMYKGDKDKLYHFMAGYGTTAVVGGFLRNHTDRLWIQVLGAWASGIAVNGAKEMADKHLGTGVYNPDDFTAGYWGATLGMFTYIIATRDIAEKKVVNRLEVAKI